MTKSIVAIAKSVEPRIVSSYRLVRNSHATRLCAESPFRYTLLEEGRVHSGQEQQLLPLSKTLTHTDLQRD